MNLFNKIKTWWADSRKNCDEKQSDGTPGDIHEFEFCYNNHDYTSTEKCKRCGLEIIRYHPPY